MLQTAEPESKTKTKSPPHPRYLEAFRVILQTRIFEDKLGALYRGGMITGGVYLGRGQEAVSAACGLSLRDGDIFAPLIRDQAGRAAFGESLLDPARTYLGSRMGPMRGRDGNIHRGRPQKGQLAMISHLGAMIPVVVGTLMAKRWRGEKDFVGLATIGEGGMQTGASHEGINIAAVEKVPFVLVATNNRFAYSTPNDREFACSDLIDRAAAYGYDGHTVDGTDLAACLSVIGNAVERARAGGPPQMVVANVLRLAGHGEHDDASYVPPEMRGESFARDSVKVAEQFILEQELMTAEELAQLREEIAAEVNDAINTAQSDPSPRASEEDWIAMSRRDLVDQPS